MEFLHDFCLVHEAAVFWQLALLIENKIDLFNGDTDGKNNSSLALRFQAPYCHKMAPFVVFHFWLEEKSHRLRAFRGLIHMIHVSYE